MRLATYTVRQMRRRPGRAALTLLGIVIGVSAIVGISVTLQTSRTAYADLFQELTGRASLEVVGAGSDGFDAAIGAELESLPEVIAAVPVLLRPTILLGSAGAVPVLAMGIDPARDEAARRYRVRAGDGPGAGVGLLLEEAFAEANGFALGQSVRFLAVEGVAELPVVGLLEASGAATFNGGAIVFMPLEVAQRSFGMEGEVNAVQLVLDDTAIVGEVESAVSARLPVGLTVQTPASRGALALATLQGTEQGLAVLSVVSLVAGAFVILNSFLMSLTERRRELAILRSVGATRRQLTRLLVGEAAALGLVGTIVGIPAGLGAAILLTGIVADMLGVALPGMRITLFPILAAAVLGPAVAIAATVVPARRAGCRPPLEGLREALADDGRQWSRWLSYTGLSVLALGVLFVLAIIRRSLPLRVIAAVLPLCMAALCVAIVWIIPLLLAPLGRLAGRILRVALRVEGPMGVRQLRLHSTRTGLTVGVLTIAIMVAVGYGNSMLNSVRDVRSWARRIGDVDFFIRGSLPDTGTMSMAAALPENLGDEIQAIDGIERVDRISFVAGRAGEQPVLILAQDFSGGTALRLDLETPEPSEVRGRLLRGEVVLGTTLAQRMGLGVGDEITLQTRAGPTGLQIAALTTEYSVGGLNLGMDWHAAKRLLGLDGVHVFAVTARAEALPRVGEQLQRFSKGRGLMIQSRVQFQEMVDRAMAGVVGSSWVVMAMVFVVASLGIVNTLTMNVIEQTHEIGVLRAIAMKRSQVRRMIIAQALAVALMSLAPGAAGGIGMTYVMNISTYPLTGFPVPFHLDATLLSACLAGSLVVAAAAAYLPARRAARLPIIAALRYE